jgi:hypothetical protein
MKEYKGTKGVSLLINNVDARWSWGVNITPIPFTPGKVARHPLRKDAGWTPGSKSLVPCPYSKIKQNLVEGKEKNRVKEEVED